MTVISQNVSVTYVSTGSVGPYAFNFSVSTALALKVIVNNSVLAPTAYTVTPVNNNLDNGGSVTLNSAPPVGQVIVIQRSTPLTQASVYADNLPQPMKQFEGSLDKLTEIVQEIVANQTGSGSSATYVVAGPGITVTGNGSLSNPFIVSTSTGFAITSFTGGAMEELGFVVSNPAFAATYSTTPTSANITNTDGISSPTTLTTPFTTGTVIGNFSSSSIHTTTFTLNATNGVSSPTATQAITWNPRIFGGVGTGGATSSVTASGTTAVLSTSDVLASLQLGPEMVGQQWTFNPSGQVIYLLLTGGSHSFVDAGTGFPFVFNAPISVIFTNVNGTVVSMFLYQSTNTLTGTFTPKVSV